MIREYANSEKISNNILKIKSKVKNMYLCINYEKDQEKGIEIEIQLKFLEIPQHFLLFDKEKNNIFKISLIDSKNIVVPLEIPPSEEILINVNYIGEETENSFVDIYPIYYKN